MTVLNTLLEITIYSAVLFGAIWLFRITLKKQLSPVMLYAMWFLLIVRLLMPVTISSGFSFFEIPAEETATPQAQSLDLSELIGETDHTATHYNRQQVQTDSNMQDIPTPQNQTVQNTAANNTLSPAVQLHITWETALIALWLAGMAVMLAITGVSALRLKKALKAAKPIPQAWQNIADEIGNELGIKKHIRIVMIEGFPSPALAAGVKPTVVLPSELLNKDVDDVRFALLHELTHIKRKDNAISLLLLILRSVYWFNPVVWLMVKQMRLDMETACDSRLTRPMSILDKKRYAGTMLSMYAQQQVRYVLGMALGQTKKTAEQRLRGMFMRSRSSHRGRMTAILLVGVLLVTCFTTACQPTPEEPAVVNQNKDLVEEVKKAAEETSNAAEESSPTASPGYLEKLVLPEHYTYNSVNETASLTINVDAGVYKPKSDKMPFARVTPMNFTQEMVTGMFNYLFPNEKPYLPRKQFTKSEIEEQILHFEKMISGGTIDGDPIREDTIAEFERMISELEAQYQTAPDEEPEPVVADGTMQYVEHTGNVEMPDENGNWQLKEVTRRYYELDANLNETSLHIRVSADETNPESSLWFIGKPNMFSTEGMVRINEGDTLPEALQGKLTISLEDAIAKADGFFEAGGIDDAKFFAAYIVDNHGTGYIDDNWDPASDYAYQLYYVRTVSGVPVSCHATGSACGGQYTEPWFYETIEILISDDGFVEIRWMEPSKTVEVVADDVELIDFDTAVERFENAIGYTYGQYLDWGEDVDVTIDVEIDNIQLNLIRLRERDKPNEKAGLYVPAYVFYGYVKETSVYKNEDYTYEGYKTSNGGGNDFYPGPMMVMAINAIDGSIINTMTDIN